MITFTPEQVDRLAQATFFGNLEARISQVEGQPILLAPEQRHELWSAARKATDYNICTIGSCLVLCHIYWELGLDCIERIPALGTILVDGAATETEKVEAMWAVRTALFDALEGD